MGGNVSRAGNIFPDVAIKAPCQVATTANIVLSGLQTIDGVATAAGDRVLVWKQTDPKLNGIYQVSSGNWIRTFDASKNTDFVTGTVLVVLHGAANGGQWFELTTTDAPVLIGASSIMFAPLFAVMVMSPIFINGTFLTFLDNHGNQLISPVNLLGATGPNGASRYFLTRAQAQGSVTSPLLGWLEIARHNNLSAFAPARYVKDGTVLPFTDAGGTTWGLDLSRGAVDPAWFGVVGDGVADDTAAIQAAINAAQAIGGSVLLGAGAFKISAALAITAHVTVAGCGFQTSPISYGFGATPNGFDTRSTGFKASVIICGVANSAFAVATADSVKIHDLHVTYPTVGNAGVAAFSLNTAAGNNGANTNSIIRDVLINNANIGIQAFDWLQFEFDNIHFVLNTYPIICENTTLVNFSGLPHSASCGDGKITGCTFFVTQGSAAIQLLSGSGYRIANNKFQGSNSGLPNATCILVAPQNLGYAFSMTPGIIADNSFEGFGNGILFAPNASSQGTLSLWTIVGNEFFCTVGINMASGITVPQWMGDITIASNVFTYGQNGSTSPCIVIAGAVDVLVGDNVFGGAAAALGAAISIGANTANIKIGNNLYSGTAQPAGVLTPALPASTVGVTNNTGYTVSVNVYGGTVGSVLVNLAGGLGGATVSLVTDCTVMLNPGDQIVLTYSAAPNWIWRASNP